MSILELKAMTSSMADLLSRLAVDRPKRTNWVPVPGDPTRTELEWVTYERTALLSAVNRERLARGLGPISVEDFIRVENLAVGHSDYSLKLSLYCAEMSLGIRYTYLSGVPGRP